MRCAISTSRSLAKRKLCFGSRRRCSTQSARKRRASLSSTSARGFPPSSGDGNTPRSIALHGTRSLASVPQYISAIRYGFATISSADAVTPESPRCSAATARITSSVKSKRGSRSRRRRREPSSSSIQFRAIFFRSAASRPAVRTLSFPVSRNSKAAACARSCPS